MQILNDLGKILLKNLSWFIPLIVGALLTIWTERINEKRKEKKILKALKHELFENFITIKLYKENYRLIQRDFNPITEFKTNIYKKAVEEAILVDLSWDIKKLLMATYDRILRIQSDYKKKEKIILYHTHLGTDMDLLQKEIKETLSLLKGLELAEKIRKVIQRITSRKLA